MMAYGVGNISGGHVNPAVSLGVLLSGGMTVVDFCSMGIYSCSYDRCGTGGFLLQVP